MPSKFDPERGFRFSTYATSVDPPDDRTGDYEPNPYDPTADSHCKELNVYLRTARELSHKLDHEPSAEEIAEQLDKPVDDVSRMLRLNERITSVDTRWVAIPALLDILADERKTVRKTPRKTMI